MTGVDEYEALRAARPELFRNLPDGIEILTDPAAVAAAGGVLYRDRYLTLLRDPVRFPDGREGTYIRSIGTTAEPGCVVLPLLDGEVVLIEHFRHATRSWHWELPAASVPAVWTIRRTRPRSCARRSGRRCGS